MTTLQTLPTTSADLHASAVSHYRGMVVREYEGLENDPGELRETLCLLGASLRDMASDVALLRLRKRKWDSLLHFAVTGVEACAPQDITDGRMAFLKQEFQRLAAIGQERSCAPGRPIVQDNPGIAAIRDLLISGREPQRTECLLSSVRSATQQQLEAASAATGLEWADEEIEHLEARIAKLREISSQKDSWRARLEERTASVAKAREQLALMEREVVVEWAVLSIDKVDLDVANSNAGIACQRIDNWSQQTDMLVGA